MFVAVRFWFLRFAFAGQPRNGVGIGIAGPLLFRGNGASIVRDSCCGGRTFGGQPFYLELG